MRNESIWYCDEGGFSGGVKATTNLESYLSQPLFVTSGLHFASKKEAQEVKEDWKNFITKHNLQDEQFQKKMFSKASNSVLKDFIDFIHDKDFWLVSVIDKKFKLYMDAIALPFEFPSNELIYVVGQDNLNKIDEIVNNYFQLLHGKKTPKEFYVFLLSKVNYGHLLSIANYKSFKNNFDIFIGNSKYVNFDHIDSLYNLITIPMEPAEQMFFTHSIATGEAQDSLTIYYDQNDEFYKLKPDDYYIANLVESIKFIDSKSDELIQLADCISRLFLTFVSYKLYEKESDEAEKIFEHFQNLNLYGRSNIYLTLKDKEKLNFHRN